MLYMTRCIDDEVAFTRSFEKPIVQIEIHEEKVKGHVKNVIFWQYSHIVQIEKHREKVKGHLKNEIFWHCSYKQRTQL